jgi:hypothetical protein
MRKTAKCRIREHGSISGVAFNRTGFSFSVSDQYLAPFFFALAEHQSSTRNDVRELFSEKTPYCFKFTVSESETGQTINRSALCKSISIEQHPGRELGEHPANSSAIDRREDSERQQCPLRLVGLLISINQTDISCSAHDTNHYSNLCFFCSCLFSRISRPSLLATFYDDA